MRLGGVLAARTRLLVNTYRGAGARRAYGDLAVVGAFAAVSTFALGRLFERLALDRVPLDDAAAVLGLVLTATFASLLVFDLHYALGRLLHDPELDLLRRAPIRRGALALLKLLDALPFTGVLLAVLALPAVFGFARAYGLPLSSGWLLPIQALALWSVPLALGLAAALALLSVVPARFARLAVDLLAGLTLALLWTGQVLLVPRVLPEGHPIGAPLVSAARRAAAVLGALPSFQWSSALRAAVAGEPVASLRHTAWLVGQALFALALYAVVAARALDAIASAIAAGAGRSARRSRRAMPFGAGLVRTLLARDARLLARDWAILSDVLMAAVLWMLAPLAALAWHQRLPVEIGAGMLVTLAVALGYEVAARAVPFEREGLEWLRRSPASTLRWLSARAIGAGALSLAIVATAGFGGWIAFRPSAREGLATVVVAIPALVLSLALGLWTGMRFGDSMWTNPRAMLRLSGRLFALFLLAIQIAGWLVVLLEVWPGGGPHQVLAGFLAWALAATGGWGILRASARQGTVGRAGT